MKNIFKSLAIVLLVGFAFACDKEDLANLDEVIYVRHKGADMPAYVHGKASEKVFLIILHGSLGVDGLSYRAGAIRDDIEAKYGVVYFDQRGSGMAQGRYGEDVVSVDIMAEDVMALTDVLRHQYGDDSRFFCGGSTTW